MGSYKHLLCRENMSIPITGFITKHKQFLSENVVFSRGKNPEADSKEFDYMILSTFFSYLSYLISICF